jgi:hypothetical protein
VTALQMREVSKVHVASAARRRARGEAKTLAAVGVLLNLWEEHRLRGIGRQ